MDYRTNFVFGIGNWDSFCVKRDGNGLFKSDYINAWTGPEKVPWVGKARAYSPQPMVNTAAK